MNQLTKPDHFPMPEIEEVLNWQKGFRVWSVIDLKDAFHQIPLHSGSRPCTAFTTTEGVWQWTVMPMGLAGAPARQQRLMVELFGDLPNVVVYIDDLLIGSRDEDKDLLANHRKDVEEVFRRLKQHKLRVKLSKCKLYQRKLVFLGQELSEDVRCPTGGHLRTVAGWKTPTNIKKLKGWLGFVGFYAAYIENLASMAVPLFALGRKGVKWQWGAPEQKAFDDIKKVLLEDACLHLIQVNKPFRIQCDACDLAVGGVLEQQNAAGEWRPCSFYSSKLTETQVRRDVCEKEAYAIIRALT